MLSDGSSSSQELLPASPSMIAHVFSSHVLRELLLLLSAETREDLDQIESAGNESSSSKGPKRPQAKPTNAATSTPIAILKDFLRLASQFLDRISSELTPAELKNKAFDKIASPSLQVSSVIILGSARADFVEFRSFSRWNLNYKKRIVQAPCWTASFLESYQVCTITSPRISRFNEYLRFQKMLQI